VSTYMTLAVGILLALALSWRDARQKRAPRGTYPTKYLSYPTGFELGLYLLFKKLPGLTIFRRHGDKGDGICPSEGAAEHQRHCLQLGIIPSVLLVSAGIPSLLFLIVSLRDGTMTLPGDEQGLLEDGGLLLLLIATPMLIYLFHRAIEAIPKAFVALIRSSASVAEEHLEEVGRVIFQTEERRSRVWVGLEIGLAITLAILIIYVQSERVGDSRAIANWNYPKYVAGNTVVNILQCIALVYFFRIGTMYILRLLWAMWHLGKVLHESELLSVEPLHPDNAGGLVAFGRLAWRIDLTLLPLVLLIPCWRVMVGADVFWWSLTVFCALAIPIFFFVPLWGVHKAMAAVRTKEVETLSSQFSRNIPIMREWLVNEELYPSEEALPVHETLERVVLLYERASRMPVWPFNIAIVAQVGVYFLIPVAMLAVQLTLG